MNTKLSDLDALSLQFMCSKSKYNKFISKTNPEEHSKKMDHNNKVKKYTKQILRITNDYLYNENTQISLDLDEAFEHFLKVCIKHIETEKINIETNGGCYEEDYKDEVLFETEPEENNSDENSDPDYESSSVGLSYKNNVPAYNWSVNPSLLEYIEYNKKNKK